MKTFEDLYEELLKATIEEREDEYINSLDEFDSYQLDCLLHPKKHPLVWYTDTCDCQGDDRHCVIELLKRLGFETIESLLNDSDMFTRTFLKN